jgi:hypothetical protein
LIYENTPGSPDKTGSHILKMNTFEAILMGIEIGYRQRQWEEENPKTPVSPETVIQTACEYYSVTLEQMAKISRKRDITTSRHITMYLLATMTDLSLTDIGRLFAGRDHATVIHARDSVTDLMEVYDNIRGQVEELKCAIRNNQRIRPLQVVEQKKERQRAFVHRSAQRVSRDNMPRTVRPSATYSNSGHINLLKSLEA